MISAEYVRKMARYNQWQNDSLFGEADKLSDSQRRRDLGGFFKSIHGTLSHILWGDNAWMTRLENWPALSVSIERSSDAFPDWASLKDARRDFDDRLFAWARKLSDDALAGELAWRSSAYNRDMSSPRAVCIVHLFNHQTHHRGQVHCMLTALGRSPKPTDLPFMDIG